MSDTVTPIAKRVKKLEKVELKSGGHDAPSNPDNGPPDMCFNEAIVWLVGEDWGDAPKCVSPVIRSFGMHLNDRLGDTDRQRLKPFILPSIGTAGDGQDDARRLLCANWTYREALPKWLDACNESEWANKLRAFPEFTKLSECGYGSPPHKLVKECRSAMWEKRRDQRAKLRKVVEAELAKKGIKDATAAAAVAVAAAAAVADLSYGSDDYWTVYKAIKVKLEPIYKEKYGAIRDEILDDSTALFGRVVDPNKAAA